MKWAKLTKEVDTRYIKDRNKIKECGGNTKSHQVGFDDLQFQLQSANEPPLGEWVIYDLSPRDFDLEERERYEQFVCGYLLFYDDITRGAHINHTVYFKWEPDGNPPRKNKVTIYISPAPTTLLGPAKYPKVAENPLDPQKQLMPENQTNPPAYGFAKDPPQPPPPPPPPMS